MLSLKRLCSLSRPRTAIVSPKFGVYIYIIYTPNLGFEIAVLDQEREQGRFRGSSKGAVREQGGALEGAGGAQREHRGSTGGAPGEHRGSKGEHYGAVQGRSRWEPEMGPLAFGLSCTFGNG